MITDPIEPSSTTGRYPETISDLLDRLEVPAGKIGMNSAEQAFALLRGIDAVSSRIQELDPGSPSRKTAAAQLDSITARLHKEAGRFIRDLGGLRALQQARAETNPPPDHSWWYLDHWLEGKRQAALKRLLVIGGVGVVLILVLAVLYNRFLAPDPRESAVYGHQDMATTLMLNRDFEGAMREIDQGLQIAPGDPNLLVMKGVLQEQFGQQPEAAESFRAAESGFENREDYLLARVQAYQMAGKLEKAMIDVQAVIKDFPQVAQAYLLRGQIYEAQLSYKNAMADYEQAYRVADKTGRSEIAAIARMHVAMLTQTINSQLPEELSATPTPTP